MLAFGPRRPGAPPVRRYDRGCGDDFDAAHRACRARVQSIERVDCHRENRWSPPPRRWRHAAAGVAAAGRLLLVHARSPWTPHDFVDTLLALPLDLAGLQYGEGGPGASLHVRAGGVDRELIGSDETGLCESDGHPTPSPLPNIIGLRRLAAAAE